jgi:hypothetical protein
MKVLLEALLGIAFVLGVAFLYFRLGLAPVATAAPPMPFEATIPNMALAGRIAKEAPSRVPITADEANFRGRSALSRELRCVSRPTRPTAGPDRNRHVPETSAVF